MDEVWKPIVDTVVQNRYVVSNLGRVYDNRNKIYLNYFDNGAGYKVYGLQRKDKDNVAIRYVHRLVAIAFIDNPENLPQVGHKDHIRENNSVDNLYWTTPKQNTADGIRDGKINSKKRPNMKKLTKEQICEVALLRTQEYGVNEIALKMGFPRTTISSVLNGRSNWELFSFALEEIKSSRNQLTQLVNRVE